MASPAGQSDSAERAHGNWAIRTQPRVLLYLTCNISTSTTCTPLSLMTYCSKHHTVRVLLSSQEVQKQAGQIHSYSISLISLENCFLSASTGRREQMYHIWMSYLKGSELRLLWVFPRALLTIVLGTLWHISEWWWQPSSYARTSCASASLGSSFGCGYRQLSTYLPLFFPDRLLDQPGKIFLSYQTGTYPCPIFRGKKRISYSIKC